MKITTLILLLICRLCSGVDPPALSGKGADVKKGSKETGLRQPPLALPPGGSHANRHGPNAQRTPPPMPGELRKTGPRVPLPGAKPTVTPTAVGKSTTKVTVNSKPSIRPDIEDVGEDLEEDLKHVKAYHENMQETIKTTLEVTSTAEPTEKPLEHKMNMSLVTVGKYTEGTLSVVTYTAKQDANIPLLLHDYKPVWKGIDSMNNKDTLVKAKVYLGSGGPVAANLTYKRVTESTTKEYCKLVRGKWTFVDKSSLERTFDEVEIPSNANASAYRTKVDSTLFDMKVEKYEGIPVLNCTAKRGVKVPKLVYDGKEVWQADGNQSCSSATFYFGKSGIIGVSFTHNSIEETLHDCFRVFSNDKWEGVNGDYYERVLHEAKNPETSVATASKDTKAKSFIDTAKFTVVNDMEDTVPVLKCTAGNGTSKLTYGSDTIWPGKKDVMCLSALLYMDGEKPTLAVLVTRDKNNKQSKVYRYHDGKQWKDGKEEDHKKKLEELKKTIENRIKQHHLLIASRTVDIAKFDANKGQSFDYTVDNVPVKMFIPKDNVTINRLVNGGAYLWSTENGKCTIIMLYLKDNKPKLLYIVRFIQGETYSSLYKDEDGKWTETEDFDYEFKKIRTAPTSSSQFTLDISSVSDTTGCRIFQASLYGIDTRFYSPNSGHHASYIAHSGVSIWTAEEGERCTFVTSYLKDGQEHLFRMTVKNTNDKSSMKYFEKCNSGWRNITKEDFNTKRDSLKSDAYRPKNIKEITPVSQPDQKSTQPSKRAPVKEIFLDIGRPDPQRYRSFDYAIDDVPTRLIVAVKEQPNKVVFGQETVWSDDTGRCSYCTVHIKDKKPVLIYMSGRSFSLYLLKTDGGWKSIDNYSEEFAKVRLAVPSTSSFSLDISTNQDTGECRVFETLFNKVNTRFYVPKAGKYAASVSNGQAVLWKGDKEKAILVRLYPSDNPTLLHMLSEDTNGAFKHSYLVKSGSKWESINKDVHDRLLSEIKATAHGKHTDVGRLRQELMESQASLDKLVESKKFTDCDGPEDPSILDIVHYEESNAYIVTNCTLDGYPTTVFIPEKGSINKVVYGSLTIWEGTEKEECKYLMFHDKPGKNPFITVFVDYMDESKFMVYEMRDKWTFSHQLLGPKNDYKTTTPTVFNLSDKTPQNVYFCDNVFNGIVHRAYSPLPGYHVQEVKETETTIWQAEDKEQCIFILSVPGTDKSKVPLLSFFVRNEDYCGFKHFEKTDKWRHIDERGYDKRLIEKKQANNVTTAVAIATIPQYKNAVTLDTVNVDHDRVDLHEDSLNGTRCLYSAKANDYFNGLSDNSKSVWKSDKDKCLTVAMYGKDELHCRLDVLSSDVITPMYFCRKAGNWSSTNYNTFHEWLRSYVKTPRIKLDLDNLDTNFFESFRYTQNGYEILYGRPLPGYVLTTVADGSTEVWEAGHNQYATEFQMSIIGDYTLLSIINHSYQVENLCFLKSSNSWSPIDEDVYDQYLVPVNDSERVQDTQLDLSKPDIGIVTGHKDVMGDITILRYTPHLGRHVTAVFFGESTIWYRKYHDEYCISSEHITKGGALFIRLLLKMGSSFEHRYFTKVEGRWVTLKEDEFKNKLGIQSVGVKIDAKSILGDESDPNVYTLNISGTVDRDKITATETTYEDVKSVTYSPKFIAGIGKVVDSDGTVWMGASDQKCVTVVISSKDGYDSLISLSINTDTEVRYKYLVKKDKEWYLIRKTKYDELLTTMYRYSLVTHTDTTFDNPITLDISTKPTGDLAFYEYTYNDVIYKTFKPKDDRSILEVVDGKSVLWKSSSGKCINAWTYSTDVSSLCRLDILSSGIITPHCFEKKGNIWISLDFRLYTEKLKKLVTHLSTEIKIDFRGLSRDLCHVLDYFDKHAISTTIVPEFRTTSIYHDNKKIWESGNGKICDRAHFLTTGRKHLAYIYEIDSTDKGQASTFEYANDQWFGCNASNFSITHGSLGPIPKEVFSGTLVDTTFDINNISEHAFKIYNYSDKTVTRFEYQTPMNANVKRVIDGVKMAIWQGTDNERCLSCEVYSREGHPPVMKLIIKNHYGLNIYYFERVDNEWNEINRNIFNLRLASLSNNSRLQLLKDRLVDTSENLDVFDRKTSYTSEEINMLYLNQWLLSSVPHWVLEQFRTFYPEKKGWFSCFSFC
ncbi:hypothetical protein BEWA_022750 [Theileria equi strain WA]|uniref:SfiI-subtelomeric related protein family member n=1 Tax=Theileria equi strain WA TaxID=1537102 RepID=L0AV03_THEEQ|nr:hypothetical protein BEWA_022750 [Theileria equi strain WA]AFZ79427.1 hypothetical protein BEWA_022750 [Theileria equi strain WA]|eukprot:XP_004829093.1 hypothetical protein BEWA_022750 [Theileria equi strain WA]